VRQFRTEAESERADAVAKRLGTYIPCDIAYAMWPLPILEAIADRLDALEKALADRES
jgi:hypothetical protein